MAAGVYIIRCSVTGEVYVGSSRDISTRWKNHCRELTKGIHRNPRLQKSWQRHGEQSFKFSVLELVPAEQMQARETEVITELNACTKGVGYNLLRTAFSRLGMPHTDATKLKMSLARRGKRGRFGIPHSEETKIKMSLAQKGRVIGEDHRRKISEALRGTPLSVETRSKISAAHKGRRKPLGFGVRVSQAQSFFDAGLVIEIRGRHAAGDSMRLLARHYGTSHKVIGKAVHGKGAFYASVVG